MNKVTLPLLIAVSAINTVASVLANLDANESGRDDRLARIFSKVAAALALFLQGDDSALAELDSHLN